MNIEEEYKMALEHFERDNYVRIAPWGKTQDILGVTIKGLENTPYKGGEFIFEIRPGAGIFTNIVKEFNGFRISEEDLNLRIFDLEQKLKAQLGISPYQIGRIYFRKELLLDNKTLNDYGFRPNNDMLSLKILPPFRFRIPKEVKSNPNLTTIADIKRDYLTNLKIKHYEVIQFILKGKVLANDLKIKDLRFLNPERDTLTLGEIEAFPGVWDYGIVSCVTLIWHPNIDSSIPPGKENIMVFWNSNKNLIELVEGLKALIHLVSPIFNPRESCNREAGEQYINERFVFETKAKQWTEKYAQKREV